MKLFRIHGDNIVECERIANLLIKYSKPYTIKRGFESLACPYVIFEMSYPVEETIKLEFFPGFNKHNNDRWDTNVLDILRAKGCFLDETPDAIITHVVDGKEEVLVAIEFCSALQAGNQAWQRSGRAYSVGRTGCPYIYIVDFVKYELDTNTRSRKALRFPNSAVVYSYVSFSNHINNFIVQAYVKSEEFQPDYDQRIKGFSETIFGEKEIAKYILLKMLQSETKEIEESLFNKNKEMVKLLAANSSTSFSKSDWENIISSNIDFLSFCKTKKLSFRKKIADKSMNGKAKEFRDICSDFAIGIASADLPFGLIPAAQKADFAKKIISLYSITDQEIIDYLHKSTDMVVCILKGFKPKGDDNRPDRGALPLISMLLDEKIDVLTFLFGPIIKTNANKLNTNYKVLFNENGLWRSIIANSNIIIVDSPVVDGNGIVETVINNDGFKTSILGKSQSCGNILVSNAPTRFQENDVDGVIHYLFKHVISSNCFEGMCNPPGGDWSGLSIILNGYEYRWLSLPRVSQNGKRPDHVVQIFGVDDNPVLLVIESKEKYEALEDNIGAELKNYLHYLFSFKPSVYKKANENNWQIATTKCGLSRIKCFSVGAFLKPSSFDSKALFERTNCDIIFSINPNKEDKIWEIDIYTRPNSREIIDRLQSMLLPKGDIKITIK